MKKKYVIAIVLTLAVLFVPIPSGICKDGGTRTYSAFTYKIVKWNKIYENAAGNDDKYQKTSVYWIPNNFKSLDELWKSVVRNDSSENQNNNLQIGFYMSENQVSLLEIKENNEYVFDRHIAMSYVPMGKYEIKDDILTLEAHDELSPYRFSFDGDTLVYQGEDILDSVKKGTVFQYKGMERPAYPISDQNK